MTRTLLGSSRPLVYLLVLLMLPVLVVTSSPGRAFAAVTAVGDTVTGTYGSDSYIPGRNVSCTFTGYTRLHDSGLYSVRATANCKFGFSYPDVEAMRLVARDANSTPGCYFESDYNYIEPGQDREVTLTGNLSPVGTPITNCNLTTGEVQFFQAENPPFDQWSSDLDAFPWALGSLPTPAEAEDIPYAGECELIKPTASPRMTYSTEPIPGNNVSNWVDVTLKLSGTFRDAPLDVYSGTYRVAANKYPVAHFLLQQVTPSGAMINLDLKDVENNYLQPIYYANGSWSVTIQGRGKLDMGNEIAGVQLQGYYNDSPTTRDDQRRHPLAKGPGYTYLPGCSFWFGPKVHDTPNDDYDEPAGPLGPPLAGPPVEVDEPTSIDNPVPVDGPGGDDCTGFSFSDPASWAGAGVCAMVKMLGALLGLFGDLLGVVSGLVGAILDGITGLFVPSDDVFTSAFDQVEQTYEGSNLDGWGDFFGWLTDAGTSSSARTMTTTSGVTASRPMGAQQGTQFTLPGVTLSGGCEGPGAEWAMFETVGLPSVWHPIAACDGVMATVASWCRLLLMMFIGIAGALKVGQMLAVSVGAARTVNALGSFDWSEATVRR